MNLFFERMVRVQFFFVLFFTFLSLNVKGQESGSCAPSDSIVMKVVPYIKDLSSDFIDVRLFNHTDFRLSCGFYYDFQKFQSGEWVDIDFGSMAWKAGIYFVGRGESRMFTCYLNKEKYKYTPGKYRVIKYITIEKEIYEKRKVFAEFVLK